MDDDSQPKKPNLPIKENPNLPVWKKPNFPNNNFKNIKQIRQPGSQHRG